MMRAFAPMIIAAGGGHTVNISSGRTQSFEQRGGIRGLQVGAERVDLLGRGRAAGVRDSGFGCGSGLGEYRVRRRWQEMPRRKFSRRT